MWWEQELENAEEMYRSIGAKLAVGMPFKDIATSDSLLFSELPDPSNATHQRALRRLQVRYFAWH